jgi:hypothetical protein
VESKDNDKDSGEVVHCGFEYCADTVLFGVCSQIGVFLCLLAGQNEGLDLVNVGTSSGLPLMLVVALEKRSLRD